MICAASSASQRADRVLDDRAVIRRDQARTAIDGMIATTGVPARIEVPVDARLKSGSQEIRCAALSRLCWANRPAMRVVQAVHWKRDVLSGDDERERILIDPWP